MKKNDLEYAQKVKEEFEKTLLELPNVTGVGIGLKTTNNSDTGRLCIRVYVSEKIPVSQLRPLEVIPPVVGELETDVIETGNIFPL
jgi:hypothetical protein